MEKDILFEEKQYLGFNKYQISRRLVLALFCFVAYYLYQSNETASRIFLLTGSFILFISVILLFVVHLRTTVSSGSIHLNSSWTSKRINIDLKNIVKVEKTKYSKYLLNNPVYNLHKKGVIRFYTGSGDDAVQITDKNGMNYLIGSSKAHEFAGAIQKYIERNQSIQSI